MEVTIRPYRSGDAESVVGLSLRAWAPVFSSMATVLGTEIFRRLYGSDWRERQAADVRSTLDDNDIQVWVATQPEVIGFVATRIADRARGLGEVWMLAVDPDHQGRGTGTALTAFATGQLRDAGMRVARISTGGDRGHAPARRVYEKARYIAMPGVQYWMAL